MFIEDYILGIAGYGNWVFTSTICNPLSQQDETFFESVAASLHNNNALTEKQGTLALKLIRNNIGRLDLKLFPDIINDLDNPQWKKPFRILPTVRTITIKKSDQTVKHQNGRCIFVEFPYDQILVDAFRKRNTGLHELYRGHWDSDCKQWVFCLTEKNIAWLGDVLLDREFKAEQEFLDLYAEVSEIRNNVELHIPMLSMQDGQYVLINSHQNIPQPATDNLSKALFFAKQYGINTWDDSIDTDKMSNTTKQIIEHVSKVNFLWFDNKRVAIDQFTDLITYGGPALIIVPGGSELENVQQWVEFGLLQGIDVGQISVMFRLPHERADFNQFVKTAGLNNPITENTRLVFVSTKITKPLVKSNIKFNTVINLGYYNYMHFTMNTVVDNATNLVYYSMKEPTKRQQWQQHDL